MKNSTTSFEEKVKEHYLSAQGEAYHLEKRKLQPRLVPWLARLRSEKFAPYLNKHQHVFEYGAGAAWNLIYLPCQKKSAYDLSKLNESIFKFNEILFIASESDIPRGSYDVVICHHVLEHVAYPGKTLTFLRGLLNSQGRLILVVPMERQRTARFNSRDPEGHLYTWTPQTLGNLVDRAGFGVEEIKIKMTGYDRFAAELASTLGVGEPGFRVLRRLAQLIGRHKEIMLVARPNN